MMKRALLICTILVFTAGTTLAQGLPGKRLKKMNTTSIAGHELAVGGDLKLGSPADVAEQFSHISTVARSEERRVGKECRSRWSPYH